MDIRDLERDSIRRFVQDAADGGYLRGRVLDLGCGLEPYRSIVVRAGGDYHGYDRPDLPGAVDDAENGSEGLTSVDGWDAILCTQVIQYVPAPLPWLREIRSALRCRKHGGYLVLTGPTNWPEVETADLHRYTLAGIKHTFDLAGFEVVTAGRRETVNLGPGFALSLGYGIVGRA
jgi:SAM-dependent methyltransferase